MPLPSFGAPATPQMGDSPQGGSGDPSAAPGPAGAPTGGDDQASSAVAAIMGKIRDLGQQASALGSAIPALQPEAQQIQQIIRRMVLKAGQAAPTQTDSASALPM